MTDKCLQWLEKKKPESPALVFDLSAVRKNFYNLKKLKSFKIQSKYKFLDQVFLKVLERNPKIMPKIFCDMFKVKANTVIKFLSNKSNFFEDISIILKMPKSTFIKALFY